MIDPTDNLADKTTQWLIDRRFLYLRSWVSCIDATDPADTEKMAAHKAHYKPRLAAIDAELAKRSDFDAHRTQSGI